MNHWRFTCAVCGRQSTGLLEACPACHSRLWTIRRVDEMFSTVGLSVAPAANVEAAGPCSSATMLEAVSRALSRVQAELNRAIEVANG